ncbi:unnamed protein product [Rhizophagus irregularis]|nr:unnamed protein product [Rhizophagus irregularis]
MKFSKKLNLFEISSNKFVALGQVIKRMGGVLKKPTDNDNTDNNTDNIDNSISSPTIQLISTEHIDAVLEWRHRTFWDCIECGYPRTGYSWCQNCESYRFEKQFPHWTSGNIDIDDFIRKSQKLAQTDRGYMEWIPHDNFTDVEYITSGGYGDIFTAVWQEGPRWAWDENDQTRIRTGPRNVTLKILDNSQNITTDFLNELASHYQYICNSLRPKAVKGTPPSFVKLMKKCWDPNPSNRPNATELVDILEGWIKILYNNYEPSDIREEFNAAEEYRINSTSAPNSPSMFHPLAIYTSRLLSFSNLKVW